jgi:hypothetical protein
MAGWRRACPVRKLRPCGKVWLFGQDSIISGNSLSYSILPKPIHRAQFHWSKVFPFRVRSLECEFRGVQK